ncbi:MAG: DUF445 domain-containing protein [Gemmatimonadetes bacterium]|nr:DUF445 domain-containing protein [Gemmatimonadota bacterium]
MPLPLTLGDRPGDDQRRERLKVMKRRATGLIVLAGVVYIIARVFDDLAPWVGFVRATAEASLVGGLADWFAVTALFRRPLGIPIPHTAIVATQKDRIGRILGNFVQNHFLSRETLATELRAIRLSERVSRWLTEPENSTRIARQMVTGLSKTIEAMPEGEIRELIKQSAVARLQKVRLAPVFGNMLTLVTTDNRHQELLNDVIRLVGQAIQDNRDTIRERIRQRSPWWVPGAVDEAIYKKLLAAIEDLLREVQATQHHPLRKKFDAALTRFIDQLKHSPDLNAKAEAMKEHLLSQPIIEELAGSLWDAARRAAARYKDAPQDAPEGLGRGISAAGESLLANEPLLKDLDDFLIGLVSTAAERHRQEVGELIARTVSAWDPDVAVRRLELAVGPDLQYIRMNGTLVGGLVGLIIHTISVLLG